MLCHQITKLTTQIHFHNSKKHLVWEILSLIKVGEQTVLMEKLLNINSKWILHCLQTTMELSYPHQIKKITTATLILRIKEMVI